MEAIALDKKLVCYHCGDECSAEPVRFDDKNFCCEGCSMVYDLLKGNGLCTYYELEKQPGLKIKTKSKGQYAYLDEESIAGQLMRFNEAGIGRVEFHLPTMHCSSCIWLLENLPKLREGIMSARVQFTQKEIAISFRRDVISLRGIVELLDAIGYPPMITLQEASAKNKSSKSHHLLFQLGVAGFCSANIMLLSFPEYFGLDASEKVMAFLFGYLNLLLSIPVLFYSASDYFVSAYKGIRNKMLNLDVPIALGMAAIFIRSTYEVLLHIGPGYFDSLTGLIFFLLIGKWYQQRTFSGFSFDRDYQSYFPIATTKVENGTERAIAIKELKVLDEILVRNQEIVPADAVLQSEEASIDYSFVTGESIPVIKKRGDQIYAGGRQIGGAIQLKVEKPVAQSYLIQLWDQEVFKKEHNAYLSSFVLFFSRYFVYGTLVIAAMTCFYWLYAYPSKILFALTSVLLVACPCALALSLPFAFGNALRWLGKYGLYMKNADAVEKLAEIDTIVFDKTGTLTDSEPALVEYIGEKLDEETISGIKSTVKHSLHPLSQSIYRFLKGTNLSLEAYEEISHKGILSRVANQTIQLGSAEFLGRPSTVDGSVVYLAINGVYKGFFRMRHHYRAGMEGLLRSLAGKFELHLVSGDQSREAHYFSSFFARQNMAFLQKPADKLAYIQQLQKEGKKVMMIGDGLNDAGALKAADLGISLSEQSTYFAPACDGILQGAKVVHLLSYLRFARSVKKVVLASLGLSLLYNFIGLYFAVRGELSPLIAAILMPLSSFTIVLFVVLLTNLFSIKLKK